jgi:hypothetical protein
MVDAWEKQTRVGLDTRALMVRHWTCASCVLESLVTCGEEISRQSMFVMLTGGC